MSRNVPSQSRFDHINTNSPLLRSSSDREAYLEDELNNEAPPPDLIPIFEKLDLNMFSSHREFSSQNSEGSTGASGSVEVDVTEEAHNWEPGAIGGTVCTLADNSLEGSWQQEEETDTDVFKGKTQIGGALGHHRSHSDNTAKLQSIVSPLSFSQPKLVRQ